MADDTTRKRLKLKRVILKEVYADNIGVMWEGFRPLNGRARRTRHWRWRNRRELPYGITLLVLLPFLALGVYFLYPQALHAIGLVWPKKESSPHISPVVTGHISGVRHTGLPEDSLPERQVNQEDPYLEPPTNRNFLSLNSPQDYYCFVSPMHVPIAKLFGLGVKTIAIDPGHGGRDPGAIGPTGLMEKDVTLDIARRLRDRLEKYGRYRIIMTRNDDVSVTLKRRAEFVNANSADLFISIHINYIPVIPLMVIETYYFGAQADEQILRIAEKENQGSDYLMAEFKGMIDKIGDKFKQQESKSLAMSIQETLYKNIRQQNATAVSRGIKPAPFVILLEADMPSILAEVTCISNQVEEKKLAKPAYREEIAHYLEDGIIQYLKKSKKKPIKGGKHYAKKN